jgi:hypothetical protein
LIAFRANEGSIDIMSGKQDVDFDLIKRAIEDKECEDQVLTNVTKRGDGYELGFGSMGFFVEAIEGHAPKPGQTVRFWGGSVVRGFAVMPENDDQWPVVYFYRSKEEQKAKHAEDNRKRAEERRKQYEEKGKAELLAAYDKLPVVFKKRLDDFKARVPDFGPEHEPYESFACSQAVLFADTLKTEAELVRFAKLDSDEQRKLVPGLSEDHSGNTFGFAVMLARVYLAQPELVPKVHAAICPLLGCKEAGCWSGTEEALREKEARAVQKVREDHARRREE